MNLETPKFGLTEKIAIYTTKYYKTLDSTITIVHYFVIRVSYILRKIHYGFFIERTLL